MLVWILNKWSIPFVVVFSTSEAINDYFVYWTINWKGVESNFEQAR